MVAVVECPGRRTVKIERNKKWILGAYSLFQVLKDKNCVHISAPATVCFVFLEDKSTQAAAAAAATTVFQWNEKT